MERKIKRNEITKIALARFIATIHLRRMSHIKEFSDLHLGKIYPIYNILGEQNIFDVKLISSGGEDRGYIIVNIDKNDFPIPEFRNQGPSITEQFRTLLNKKKLHVLWLTPTFSVVVDKDYKILANIGSYIPDDNMKKNLVDPKNTKEFFSLIWEEHLKLREDHKETIKKTWERLIGASDASDLVVDDIDDIERYIDFYAEGYERAPIYVQIAANTGANIKDCSSGCGPTAWAILLGWHNLMWTPDFLRGSQDQNYEMSESSGAIIGWGPDDSPNHEDVWNTYTDRLIMEIADKLNTFCWFGKGVNFPQSMDNIYEFIENFLGNDYSGDDKGGNNANDLNKIFDYLQIHKRPIVIYIPGHYCVAGGAFFNPEDLSTDSHFLYICTGWDQPDHVKYLSTAYLKKYWYLQKIHPKEHRIKKYTFNEVEGITSPYFEPVIITTNGSNTLFNKNWIFWLGVDNKIYYMAGNPGDWPNISNIKKIVVDGVEITSIFAPAMTYHLEMIILVYVDESNKIHLIYEKAGLWTNFEYFPNNIKTDVKPAISGDDTWLTLAFYTEEEGVQKMTTKMDFLRPEAWPTEVTEILSPTSEKYWKVLGGTRCKTDYGLTMVDYSGCNVLCWRYRPSEFMCDYSLGFWIEKHMEKETFKIIHQTNQICSSPNLSVSNDTLYLTYRTYSDRITIDVIYNIMYFGYILVSQKAYLTKKCKGDPSLGFIDKEGGKHPMLVLCTKNLDVEYSNNQIIDYPSIRLWRLSIDNIRYPINYEGHP